MEPQPRPVLRALRRAALPLVLLHSATLVGGATDTSDLFGDNAASPQVPPPQGSTGHKKKHKDDKGWRLLRHSFEHTLSFDDTLLDWLFSAASMPLRDRVNVLPPVPDRHGIGFNKRAIDTRDFEVEFALGAVSPAPGPQDGFLAFWVGNANYTAEFNDMAIVTDPDKDWSKGMASKGLTFLNNKPNFPGLVLAFIEDNGKQYVAGLWNDGSRPVSRSDLTSAGPNRAVQEIDWVNKVVEAKARFTPDGALHVQVAAHDPRDLVSGTTWSMASNGVNVDSMVKFEKDGTTVPKGTWSISPGNKVNIEFEAKSHKRRFVVRLEGAHRADVVEGAKEPKPALMRFETAKPGEPPTILTKWHTVLTLPQGTQQQQKSFIGFTGYTGKSSHIEVDMHRLIVTNFDMQKVGEEDVGEAVEGGLDPAWLKLLEDEKKFLDQATQAQAVVELTKFLTEHVGHYETIANKLKMDISGMETRVENLGSDIANYLTLIQAFNFDTDKFDPGEVKSHIKGIRSVLSKAAEKGDAKLGEVHQAAKELKATGGGQKITEGAKKKAETVQQQAETVEQFAAQGARQTNIMLFILLVAVGGLGSLFFNRMRYYEKKHYI